MKRLQWPQLSVLKTSKRFRGHAKANEGQDGKGIAEFKRAVGRDVLAGGSHFPLTFPWGFLSPCSCPAAGDGAEAHCSEFLTLTTGTGRTTTAFATKAARRTKDQCYEANPT